MTGVQALERIAPDLPIAPGKVARREFEYRRHGTQTVIAAFDVATGQVTARRRDPHRAGLRQLPRRLFAGGAPTTEWRVIADNLNTHVSESVVRLVADCPGSRTTWAKRASPACSPPWPPARRSCVTPPTASVSLHAQARVLAKPDRDLVLHPRAQAPAPRELCVQGPPEGPHRSLHRLFQPHPRQALQMDHDRQAPRA